MYTLIKINFPFSYLENGEIPVPKRHCRAYVYIYTYTPTNSAVIIIINPRPLTRPTGDHHCRVVVGGERGWYKSVLFIRVRRLRHDLYDLYLNTRDENDGPASIASGFYEICERR